MKFKSIHFYWTALAITTIAFTFSLFANPTTDDNSNTYNNNSSTTSSYFFNERDGKDKSVGNGTTKDVERISPKQESKIGVTNSRITQTEEEHVKQGNGSMYAIDLVTVSGDAYFPEKHSEYFIVHIGEDARIGNYIIIRHGKERWVYGHTVTSRSKGEYVQSTGTNNVLGQYNKSGISTAKHVHIERWLCPDKHSKMYECQNVASTGQVAPRSDAIKHQRGWVERNTGKDSNGESNIPKLPKVTVQNRGDSITVIACLNEKDMTIHETKQGTCFLGNGGKWKNIMIPPQKDIDMFKKVFGDDWKYRLAIANFEGSFREDNGNPYAHGYLQTLRSYKIPKDIESQLNWLAKREIGTTGRICDLNNNAPYGGDTKLDRYTCMARGHFGFHKPDSKHYAHGIMYGKRYRAATEYYLSLNF